MPIPSPSTTCPKCSQQMEFGLLADSTFGMSGAERVLEWVRGIPGKNWWTLSFKAAKEDRLQVASLRCKTCGYLELYAPTEPTETPAKG